MTVAAAITLGIGIAGFISGIIWKVADLSTKFGKLQQTVNQNTERAKEERDKTQGRLDELYAKTTAHESSIAALTSSVNALMSTCTRIEGKLDRLIEKSN